MLLFLINYFALGSFYESTFLTINNSIFEPILYWAICIVVCSLVLVFFKESIFDAWMRRVFIWYVPFGMVLTFLTSPNLSYSFPDRFGVATVLGWGLVILTVVFVLTQVVLNRKNNK